MSSGIHLCRNCQMTFSNASLLYKHQSRFCVGGPSQPPSLQNKDYDRSTPSSVSSMSIHLPDEPSNQKQHEYDNKQSHLRMLRDSHGHNLADLQMRNRELEHQKQEIERRLAEPGQWQAQGARNQDAMNSLRQQLHDLRGGIPLGSDHSLIGEIMATREAYLRQGGNNAGLLATLADLETEARALIGRKGKAMQRKKIKEKNHMDELAEQLAAFEAENKRLELELLRSQEMNNERLKRQRNKEEEELLNREIALKQKEHLARLAELEHEMEIAKQKANLERLRQELAAASPPVPPPQPQPRVPEFPPVQAEYPVLMQPQYSPVDVDPLFPASYDSSAGFMIFYDFLMGLDFGSQALRLVTGLYNNTAQYGEPTILPTVYAEPTGTNIYSYSGGSNYAIVGARQPVFKCPAQRDLGLVIELQTSSAPMPMNPYFPTPNANQHSGRMITKAWTKVPLFDSSLRLISGRWRIPMRITPIRPHLSPSEINMLPLSGQLEIYVRFVNARDADTQSMGQVNAQNAGFYNYPPQVGSERVPPPPDTPPPPTPTAPDTRRHRPTPTHTSQVYPFYEEYSQSDTIGFQVDRVKFAEPGEAKVRLTVYNKSSGQIVKSSTIPVTCSTSAVQSNFKHQYHVFGQQEAYFNGVPMDYDNIVIARLYLRTRVEYGISDMYASAPQDNRAFDDETLVAWGALPLMSSSNDTTKVNIGTHTLNLYEAPVPNIQHIPLESHWKPKTWKRYGKANLKLHIFQGRARPGELTDSEDEDEQNIPGPVSSWIPHMRDQPTSDPYTGYDGFDLYVDCCKNLPDGVTFTRIAGRVMDRKYERVGKDINTSVQLDSDIYNPIYEHRVEYREPNLPPSSTLLLKVYTIDRISKTMMVVGYATLNIFVETGDEKQPSTDAGGIQVSLNEGGHQLRLYAAGPDGLQPLTADLLREQGTRYIPCATILVRLVKAPKGPNGRCFEAEKVPQADWERLGLWVPRPAYNQKKYYSMSCSPTKGENKLFVTLLGRPRVSVREAAHTTVSAKDKNLLSTDKGLETYIKKQLTKLMDVTPLDYNLTYICQYNPKDGIMLSIDAALNLPWASFTHAHFCLNPPGAFYKGLPDSSFDKLKFTEDLDLASTNKSPEWRDGFKHYPYRSFHRYLTMIIHLQEINVSVSREAYKYSLVDQGWTAIQIFENGYAVTDGFQLPLFQGSPNKTILSQLCKQPCKEFIRNSLINGTIRLLDGASVFVRLCDARREEELSVMTNEETLGLDKSYLPKGHDVNYDGKIEGQILTNLVPQGKMHTAFRKELALKFKSLVYKLNEEGKVSMN